MIADLLAPGGYAYLCAHAPIYHLSGFENEEELYEKVPEYHSTLLKLDESSDDNDIYHELVEYDVIATLFVKNNIAKANKYLNIKRPKSDSVECNIKTVKKKTKGEYMYTKQHSIYNYFSPKIYRKSVLPHPNLEVEDAFFMNTVGSRFNGGTDPIWFAAAIIKKRDNKIELEKLADVLRRIVGLNEEDRAKIARIAENDDSCKAYQFLDHLIGIYALNKNEEVANIIKECQTDDHDKNVDDDLEFDFGDLL